MRQGRRCPLNPWTILRILVLLFFAVIFIYPFIWIFLTSFKGIYEVFANSFGLPRDWLVSNYTKAWHRGHIDTALFNSALISCASVGVLLLFSSMASYVLARVWPNKLVYTYIILGMMIPAHALLIPTFIIVKKIGLINSRLGLIVVYIAIFGSLAVFILVGFMKSIPRELEEAAAIDGYPKPLIYVRIILPLSKAGLATIGTLAFLDSWNEYLHASVIIYASKYRPVMVAVEALHGWFVNNYGPICAALVITILPLTMVYTIFQKQIVRGMTAGAVKS